MFNDQELAAELDRNGFQFSSANSINIGRLVPQIVYYVYAYAKLVKAGEINAGEKINITLFANLYGLAVEAITTGVASSVSRRYFWYTPAATAV